MLSSLQRVASSATPRLARGLASQNKNTTAKVFVDKNTRSEADGSRGRAKAEKETDGGRIGSDSHASRCSRRESTLAASTSAARRVRARRPQRRARFTLQTRIIDSIAHPRRLHPSLGTGRMPHQSSERDTTRGGTQLARSRRAGPAASRNRLCRWGDPPARACARIVGSFSLCVCVSAALCCFLLPSPA